MRRALLLLYLLLLLAPVLHAQPRPPSRPAPDHSAFAPPASFRPSMMGPANAYTCTPAQAGPDGRCASTAIPGNLKASDTPQFMLITFDDCMTTQTESHVRKMLTPDLKNPDGRPIPSTYFVSLEGCPGEDIETEQPIVKQRYAAGDEIAVHTRTHTTNRSTTYAQWVAEITYVKGYFEWLGLGADAGRGFRAPYLATNPAMYKALDDLGYLYDSSVYESPFWSPVSQSTKQYLWPFTYDVWNMAKPAQLCAGWSPDNTCPEAPASGLWQVPLYYYVGGTEAGPTYYGVMDVGSATHSGYSTPLTGNTLLNVLRTHRNARLSGNRTPLSLYFHASGLTDAAHQSTYRTFLSESLARGDVWAVTMQGLIEWMKAPVPNSKMKAWYNGYCQRHPCSAPVSRGDTHDDDGSAEQSTTTPTRTEASVSGAAAHRTDLRVFPSPSRGPVSIEATTITDAAVLTVHDVLGREVSRKEISTAGAFMHHVDLGPLAAGLYVVRLTDGAHTTTRTVLVQH